MIDFISQPTAEALNRERRHQIAKWGADKPQSLAGYLLVVQHELNEAIAGWMKNKGGRDSCLAELTQAVTVALIALEEYGTDGSAISTPDIPIVHP